MMLCLAAALTFTLHATSSQVPFEGNVEVRIVAPSSMGVHGKPREPVTTSLRLFFTKRVWRIEKEIGPPTDPALLATVRDMLGGHEEFRLVALGKAAEPTKRWIVNDRTKRYALLVVDSSSSLDDDAKCWTVSRTGTDVVAGLTCENVVAQRKDGSARWEACIASDLPSTAMESLTRLEHAPMESGSHTDAERWIATGRRSGVSGRPLRARVVTRAPHGSEESRIEVVKVERRALPASLLEIPPDYRETSAFQVTAQSAEAELRAERNKKLLVEQMERWPPEMRKAFEQAIQLHGGEKP